MSAPNYRTALEAGWGSPVRHRLGDAVNTWAAEVNASAEKLDALAEQMSPEVQQALRGLFTEIGQRERDYWAIIESLRK